jgi:tetratricopeptide (TPR) repeat protein
MRKNHRVLFALSTCVFVTTAQARAQSVVVEVSLRGEHAKVEVPGEKARETRELVEPAERARAARTAVRPRAGVSPRAKGSANAGARAHAALVEKLATQYRLDEKTKVNPHLAFGPAEIADWAGRELDEPELRLQFAARRAVLEAADEHRVAIKDQAMLSHATDEFIRILKEEGRIQAQKPVRMGASPPPNRLICEGKNTRTLIKQAWEALEAGKAGQGDDNLEMALACAGSAIDGWAEDADEQQATRLKKDECRATPARKDMEAYFETYWALADIAAAWFIRGKALTKMNKVAEAKEAYKVIVDKYSCAYIWSPDDGFWSAARGASQEINNLSQR